MKNKIIGIIPARMAASRFPGKPLKLINGMPMLMHVYLRAKLYKSWDKLSIAGCDKEILNFCKKKNIEDVATSRRHKRCLDRVFEATKNIKTTSIISYGDTLAKINLSDLLTKHKKSNSLMSLVIAPIRNPFGIVKWNNKNKLTIDA